MFTKQFEMKLDFIRRTDAGNCNVRTLSKVIVYLQQRKNKLQLQTYKTMNPFYNQFKQVTIMYNFLVKTF